MPEECKPPYINVTGERWTGPDREKKTRLVMSVYKPFSLLLFLPLRNLQTQEKNPITSQLADIDMQCP